MLNVPLAIVDATVLTEAGYVGEDVESILSVYFKWLIMMLVARKGALFLSMKLTKLRAKVTTHQSQETFRAKVFNKHYLNY